MDEILDRLGSLEALVEAISGDAVPAATANTAFLAAIVAALVRHNAISVIHVEDALAAQRKLIESLRAQSVNMNLEVAAHDDLERKLSTALSWQDIDLARPPPWETHAGPGQPWAPAND
ncbi:MAG: hypothetical protein H2041_01425 [Phenylobacterium sp.]|uniref:hypothetical protein n=1 Tax=Phenylobacterium sp. TaxID=1871053 RepID=UPI001856E7B0|nr:hypothetical protein [Phenylobacterium sp.]MBA4792306.1 hypothetical protein [Phenylobacterium sp.]